MDHLELIAELSRDRAAAAELLFKHRHPDVSPDFHVRLMDDWANPAYPYSLDEAFRQGAKSTKAEEALILEACFGNFHYAMIFGETYDKACSRLAAIKHELEFNEKLVNIFGKLKSKPWNENEIVTTKGTKIEAVGWDQEIRSYKYLTWRPQIALLDDIENREMVRDSETVDWNMGRMFRELIPAMDVNVRIRMVGTPLAADCMVTRIRDMKEWRHRAYPICDGDIDDPNTKSAWPARYPMEWIRRQRDMFAAAGQLKAFMQEFMLVPHTALVKPFDVTKLRDEGGKSYHFLPKFAAFDPARTANIEKSDRTGRSVVSFSGSKIIIHESSGDFFMPDQVQDAVMTTDRIHKPVFTGIEKNSLDEWLMQPMRARMLKDAQIVPIIPLNAPQDKDKDAFIMTLQPFLNAGDIVLVGGVNAHAILVEEMKNFPAGKKDALNALALAVRMRPGLAVYEDMDVDNIVAFKPQPNIPLQLAVNATPSENAFALLQMEGRHMHVFRSWVKVGDCTDAVKGVLMSIRTLYPTCRDLQVWAPAEAHDNPHRTQIVAACRRNGLTPYRGDFVARTRGSLKSSLRTVVESRRLLTISPEATDFINALAAGYHSTMKPNGNVSDAPVANHYRTLVEAVECISSIVSEGFGQGFMAGAHQATTREGATYYTSMPGHHRT